MKKIFITYGDAKFKNTLHRIKSEAKSLGIFDKIIIYTPDDLPDYIKASPAMAFERGGGYWVWKPYIIWHTLQQCEKDDIVVYTDAGCTLQSSDEWGYYFDLINNKETIVFNYRSDVDYGWEKSYSCNSPSLKYWTKKSVLQYFNSLFVDDNWYELNKILSGFIICRNNKNSMIKDWLSVCTIYPDLLLDTFAVEFKNQYSFFVEHRHDQSVLAPLAYYYQEKDESVLVLPETLESQKNTAAVTASRLRSIRSSKMSFIKKMIGASYFYTLKHYYHTKIKQKFGR